MTKRNTSRQQKKFSKTNMRTNDIKERHESRLGLKIPKDYFQIFKQKMEQVIQDVFNRGAEIE